MQWKWNAWLHTPHATVQSSDVVLPWLAWHSIHMSIIWFRQMAQLSTSISQTHNATAFHLLISNLFCCSVVAIWKNFENLMQDYNITSKLTGRSMFEDDESECDKTLSILWQTEYFMNFRILTRVTCSIYPRCIKQMWDQSDEYVLLRNEYKADSKDSRKTFSPKTTNLRKLCKRVSWSVELSRKRRSGVVSPSSIDTFDPTLEAFTFARHRNLHPSKRNIIHHGSHSRLAN